MDINIRPDRAVGDPLAQRNERRDRYLPVGKLPEHVVYVQLGLDVFFHRVAEHLARVGVPLGKLRVGVGVFLHAGNVFFKTSLQVFAPPGVALHEFFIKLRKSIAPRGDNKAVLCSKISVDRHRSKAGLLGNAVNACCCHTFVDE